MNTNTSKNLFFQLHPDYVEQYDQIKDDKEFRNLIYALHEYAGTGKTERQLSPLARMAFSFIKNHIDRSRQKYKDMCEKNRENINKRYNK